MNTNAKIDAIQLMLTDLRTRNEPIRHKAAFRGCQPEFQTLVTKLIEQKGIEVKKDVKILEKIYYNLLKDISKTLNKIAIS